MHNQTFLIQCGVTTLAGIEIEFFKLPNGDYVMSHEQMASAIGEAEDTVQEFLNSYEAISMLSQDIAPRIIEFTETSKQLNLVKRIDVVSLQIVSGYWLIQAIKGNVKAESMLFACTLEILNCRADNTKFMETLDSF